MPQLLHNEFDVKIISISRKSVSPDVIEELDKYLVYKDTDQDLMEDLYTIEDCSKVVHPELIEIRMLCEANNAAYFRLVKM